MKALVILLLVFVLTSCQSGDLMTLYSEGETTVVTTEAVTEAPELPVGSLKLIALTESVPAGRKASVTVQGLPDTEYSITVTYESVSHAKGLEGKVSDTNGVVSWEWRVGNRTKPGKYKIEIQCKTEKITLFFTVTESVPETTK